MRGKNQVQGLYSREFLFYLYFNADLLREFTYIQGLERWLSVRELQVPCTYMVAHNCL